MIIGQNDQLFRAGGADRFAVSEGRRADGTPYVRVDGVKDFLIWQTFDCGQCFRFDPTEDGGFDGVALGRYVRFSQPSTDRLEITGSDVADFENIWKHYLALDDDYVSIRAGIAESTADAAGRPGAPDPVMGEAMRCGSGIRILHQEPWETLCSFIVSQNNNIPRIKKIIAAMSEKYGEPLNAGGETYYAFPTAEALVDAGVGGLAELKTGFRAKYIYDAAYRTASGMLDFDEIRRADYGTAEKILCGIKGVGPKVAACTLLFGFGKTEAFPIDVWMKRVLAKYYPDGLDVGKLGKYAGIAQQYLFYYERYFGGEI